MALNQSVHKTPSKGKPPLFSPSPNRTCLCGNAPGRGDPKDDPQPATFLTCVQIQNELDEDDIRKGFVSLPTGSGNKDLRRRKLMLKHLLVSEEKENLTRI